MSAPMEPTATAIPIRPRPAVADAYKKSFLAPPAITALQDDHYKKTRVASLQDEDDPRRHISRTPSVDMRAEREDLKTAAEQSLNVMLDLGLDGRIRWVSPQWRDVVGTPTEEAVGRNIGELLLSSKDAFANAVEAMRKDDSKSRIVRCVIKMGPYSTLRKEVPDGSAENDEAIDVEREGQGSEAKSDGKDAGKEEMEQGKTSAQKEHDHEMKEPEEEEKEDDEESQQDEEVVNLKGQGIMVYDRSSGEESHTMWMLRPSTPPKEITIDLPEVLVEALGVGAELLAQYLTNLAESDIDDPDSHPPPAPIMCRICERHITPWWFEKHAEGCTHEYRAESDVSLAQESLAEHRPAIVKVLDALDPDTRQSRPPVSGESAPAAAHRAEYKGIPIGNSSGSSPSPAGDSGRASPATSSRDTSLSRLNHSRSKSFVVRRPLSRIVTLLVDLCDTALDISMPTIKPTDEEEGHFRTQSPQSESRISQILSWQTPSVATSEEELGLATLIKDTEILARAKVEAVLRHREVLEYTERIRIEFNALVSDCIDAAVKKASSIKAGHLTDSSESEPEAESAQPVLPPPAAPSEGHSAYASPQRRDSGSPSALLAQFERRHSSVAASSTRSSSPLECPTPRSHVFSFNQSNLVDSDRRSSMLSDHELADYDTNMSRSAVIPSRRTESPEISARSASSDHTKRRSLKLPSMPSPHRQPSPARISAAPASPLRIPKPRLPIGLESMPSLPSPVTSPPLSTTEASSPAMPPQRHRRQSSAASSVVDSAKPPPSPRLNALSQPPPRPSNTSIKDFDIIKAISKGAFGSVYLAKKKTTGDYFAIKVLRKADMVAKNQVTNVKAERAIMMWQGESDFVAKLYWTFANKDHLFLVMEYLNGGDCASLIKVLGGLPEEEAKRYIAEVVLGVEHLHGRGIVHRDLKPDNLLIDQKGHLKLTDFGLSRMGLIGRQKRALKSPNDSTPDLLKQGPFNNRTTSTSIASSRSASFDLQGTTGPSPQSTPLITPDLAGGLGQPSYFNLGREPALSRQHSRRKSGYRSDSGTSESLTSMFRNFSLNDDNSQRGEMIEEESRSESGSPDPYALKPSISNTHASMSQSETPPQPSTMLPPPMALFDPQDQNRRFVGTPDYLAPETINGIGQDEMSDWWSLGCILFEFLYGYPPFHADTPEKVFANILSRKIDWPPEDVISVSADAKDIMSRFMTLNPKDRLGANIGEKYPNGGAEIRAHPWFKGINWDSLLEDEASFVPRPEHPEDTEYFDSRGATLATFAEEISEQSSSPNVTPGAEYPDRPHDALSRVRSQVNSMKRGLIPLHIPPHVRDNRNRRLSEPVANDDFGNFAFKNLPVLEKANKDLLQKLRAEAAQKQGKGVASTVPSSSTSVTGPSLEGSPLLPGPLKRTLSTNRGPKRPESPSAMNQPSASPHRTSQPSSPMVSFSTGQHHERRKTSSSSSTFSYPSGPSLPPTSAFDPPKLSPIQSVLPLTSAASSPVKSTRHSLNMLVSSPEKTTPAASRPQSMYMSPASTRARSQTVGSSDGDTNAALRNPPTSHHKRQSQVFDVSPSSSDNEDPRTKALLRVQRRRQSSRRMSQIVLNEGPVFRPLDVLICEDHPVSRLVMERLLEKLKCRTITAINGPEAARYAMSEVQFDIIMMEFKLPQINGADVARMIREMKSANTHTPIIAVTGYLKELPSAHHFDALIEKPATMEKITDVLQTLCQWKPAPAGVGVAPPQQAASTQRPTRPMAIHPASNLRQSSRKSEDSPSSQSSGPFSQIPGLRKRPSREHSIGSSSFFGDTDSTNTEDMPVLVGRQSDDWPTPKGLGISESQQQRGVGESAQQKSANEPAHRQHSATSSADSATATATVIAGLPALIHQNSAPPSLDRDSNSGSNFQRLTQHLESGRAKRLMKQGHVHEVAAGESGDDEDDELGLVGKHNTQDHTKQRKVTGSGSVSSNKRSSKLGIEMMRANSRGGIDEHDNNNNNNDNDVPPPPPVHPVPNLREERADIIAAAVSHAPTSSPPPPVQTQVHRTPPMQITASPSTSMSEIGNKGPMINPPELFSPSLAGGEARDVINVKEGRGRVDSDATPRPSNPNIHVNVARAPASPRAAENEVGEGEEDLDLPIQVPLAPKHPT